MEVFDRLHQVVAGQAAVFESTVRLFAETRVYQKPSDPKAFGKVSLDTVLKEVVKFLSNKGLTQQQEEKLLLARKARNSISHNNLSELKSILDSAGIKSVSNSFIEYEIGEIKSIDDFIAAISKPGKSTGVDDKNGWARAKMYDASVSNGVYENTNKLFDEAISILESFMK